MLASNLSGPAYWDALDEHGDMLAGLLGRSGEPALLFSLAGMSVDDRSRKRQVDTPGNFFLLCFFKLVAPLGTVLFANTRYQLTLNILLHYFL